MSNLKHSKKYEENFYSFLSASNLQQSKTRYYKKCNSYIRGSERFKYLWLLCVPIILRPGKIRHVKWKYHEVIVAQRVVSENIITSGEIYTIFCSYKALLNFSKSLKRITYHCGQRQDQVPSEFWTKSFFLSGNFKKLQVESNLSCYDKTGVHSQKTQI